MAACLHRPEDLRRVLQQTRTIAVLGASDQPARAGWYVPDYLRRVGYRVLPVNPRHVGQTLFGEPVRASLAEIEEPIDLVDVFRRPQALPAHVEEILTLPHRPSVVWLQLGVRNDDAARRLVEAGIDVVQDRCTLAEHRALSIPPRG